MYYSVARVRVPGPAHGHSRALTASHPPPLNVIIMATATPNQNKVQTCLGDQPVDDAHQAKIVAVLQELGKITKPKQVMSLFTDHRYKKVGGQQLTAACLFCKRDVTSTGATRLVEHTASCPLVPKDTKDSFLRLLNQKDEKRVEKRQLITLIAEEVEHNKRVKEDSQQALRQQGIKAGFQEAAAAIADEAIANFFYSNALSFAAASTKADSYFRDMVAAIQKAPPGYVPPGPEKLSGPLLERRYAAVQKDLDARDAEGLLSSKFGCTYVSDGWDSIDHLPLVNAAFITANDGGRYWRSVDTSGITKSAEYLAALMIQDIYAFGCTKVVMVVTDTCSTMRKSWDIVEDEFPWISILPCQPHVISLLMKDVAQIEEVKKTTQTESLVVSWFSNHHKPLAILREKSKELLHKSLGLVKACATRMGTHTLVGDRLLQLQPALQATVVDAAYVAEKYKDLPDEAQESNCETILREHRGGTAKKAVLDDDGFWKDVKSHVKATFPLLNFLRRHDSSAPTIGKVYSGWFELGQTATEIKDDCAYAAIIKEKIDQRWAYGHADIAAAAYVLDPEFISHDQMTVEEVAEGFMNCVEKIAILVEVRKHADDYMNAWRQRAELIKSNPAKQVSV